MLRTLCLSILAAVLLSACAAPAGGSNPDSFFRCDRNGEREQRAAC